MEQFQTPLTKKHMDEHLDLLLFTHTVYGFLALCRICLQGVNSKDDHLPDCPVRKIHDIFIRQFVIDK